MKYLLTSLALSIVLAPGTVLAQSPPSAPAAPADLSPQVQLVQITPNQRPLLTPLDTTKQIQLQLVNCEGWLGLDCWLARLILPASTQVNQRQLQFFNAAGTAVTIQSQAIVAEGSSGYQLTIPPTKPAIRPAAQSQPVVQPAISLPSEPQTLPAAQIVSLPLTLNRGAMPPEQYNGAIYLGVTSGSSPTFNTPQQQLVLPLSLAVRSGPLIPLAVLFLGILLGRLLKYMQERGEPQAQLLQEVYRLQADINNARLDDREKQLLRDMLAEVKTTVAREKLDMVPGQVQAIRDRLDTLVRLESLEEELNQQATTFPTDVDQLTIQIRKARLYLAQREDAKAKEVLQQIQADLDALGTRGKEDAMVTAVHQSLVAATIATEQIGQSSTIVPAQPMSGFQRFFITLSGVSEQVRAEATYWVVRPLLALILLIGLSAVGLQSLYVDQGATFGARPFSDYLALILWGLSADVASRSLSNLSGVSTRNE